MTLADGTTLPYGKLLVATGAVPRRLPVPGADAENVLYPGSHADSDAIRATFGKGRRRGGLVPWVRPVELALPRLFAAVATRSGQGAHKRDVAGRSAFQMAFEHQRHSRYPSACRASAA